MPQQFQSQIKRHVHLVGMCGAGMKGLAEVLIDRGWYVCGSDASPNDTMVDHLERLGGQVNHGHAAENVSDQTDLLVYSPAVPESNCERQIAELRGIPQWSYIDALRELNRDNECVAVVGTHGKSSTTALLAHILIETGYDPTVFCGAQSISNGRNGRGGGGRFTVMEACEYRHHFLNVPARHACLLSIEPDHFDCFPTFESGLDAYHQFVGQLPAEGSLVVNADCPGVNQVLRRFRDRTSVKFSLKDRTATWFAKNCVVDGDRQSFEIVQAGQNPLVVNMRQVGRHVVANALAAISMAVQLGVRLADACATLATFQGLKRRFERMVAPNGLQIVDDYAHHPTEIQATLETARNVFPGHELVCVFQPHQVSRTESLMEGFADSLCLADRVYVLPVFGARESCMEKFEPTSRILVDRISHSGTPARYISTLDRVWPTLDTDAAVSASHIVLTLGAGDITRINNEFYRTIR